MPRSSAAISKVALYFVMMRGHVSYFYCANTKVCHNERHVSCSYYNDSKATNVGATIAALQGLKNPVILIAGGQGKKQDFSPLKAVCATHCRAIILFGQDAPIIARALSQLPVMIVKTIDEAVVAATKLAQPHDIVLLSPACASLDMFTDYQARGNTFAALVDKMKAVA